jgi:peptide/nickel transport system substrate-binding protein
MTFPGKETRVEADSGSEHTGHADEAARFDRRTALSGAAGAIAAGILFRDPGLAGATLRRAETGGATSGGILKVGMVGNGPNQVLDPQNQQNVIDTAHDRVLFDTLARQRANGSIEPRLALTFEPNKTADVWTVTLRPDVVWHDGKPFTAADVAYSYRRIIEKKLAGAGILGFIDPKKTKVLDKQTVRFFCKQPYVFFDQAAATSVNTIIQAGAGAKPFTTKNLIGTGPFKLGSIVPGQKSVLLRNPNYFERGKPHIDELQFIIIPDSTGRLNALLAGQVDAIEQLNATQAQTITARSGFAVLNSPSGHWVPMCMDVTKAPFNDVRVRQALRLIPDRPQMVANALSGFGKIGNDLFAFTDPLYNSALPQRTQDIERAKFLLKQAGQSDLTVDLQTADAATGMLASALIYAENAKAAGVTINVVKNPADSYYSQQYMKTPFFYSEWADRPLDPQFGLCLTAGAPYNETQYHVPAFDRLVSQARKTLNPAKRKDLMFAAQRMLYDTGGYIIWGFVNFLDGYNAKVKGLHPNPGRSLGFYNFNDVTLA